MINGVFTVALNIILNLILLRLMEHHDLALATSMSALVITVLLFIKLRPDGHFDTPVYNGGWRFAVFCFRLPFQG